MEVVSSVVSVSVPVSPSSSLPDVSSSASVPDVLPPVPIPDVLSSAPVPDVLSLEFVPSSVESPGSVPSSVVLVSLGAGPDVAVSVVGDTVSVVGDTPMSDVEGPLVVGSFVVVPFIVDEGSVVPLGIPLPEVGPEPSVPVVEVAPPGPVPASSEEQANVSQNKEPHTVQMAGRGKRRDMSPAYPAGSLWARVLQRKGGRRTLLVVRREITEHGERRCATQTRHEESGIL